jgi:hypothetical protein
MANSAPIRTQIIDTLGNLARGWTLFFSDLISGASQLLHAGAIPKVSAPGVLVESAISDDGTTVAIVGRKTRLGGFVGIGGAGAPLYPLDIRVGATTPGFHVCDTDADKGTFLINIGGTTLITNGAVFISPNWIAKDTTATILNLVAGIHIYYNTGLTPGSSFTPTLLALIDSAGNLSVTGNVTSATTDMAALLAAIATLTSTKAAHGTYAVVAGSVTI